MEILSLMMNLKKNKPSTISEDPSCVIVAKTPFAVNK